MKGKGNKKNTTIIFKQFLHNLNNADVNLGIIIANKLQEWLHQKAKENL